MQIQTRLNDPLLLKILRDATAGYESYRPIDHRVPTLREFQLIVQAAQQAHQEGLIEASFPPASKGKITAGLVRAFTVTKITRRGLECLSTSAGIRPQTTGEI